MRENRSTTFRDLVADLAQFLPGGGALAAGPGARAAKPAICGAPIAGVAEAREWLVEKAIEEAPAMLFLVGAPGNGKSLALEFYNERLKLQVNGRGERRSYSYCMADRSDIALRVVNDASALAEQGEMGRFLIRDIEQFLSSPRPLHVNVNRGILYQEIGQAPQDSAVRELLEWIVNPSSDRTFNSIRRVHQDEKSNCVCGLWQPESEGTGVPPIVPIVVVSMDTYSLFEIQPKFHLVASEDVPIRFPVPLHGERYSITQLQDSARLTRAHWLQTPAGDLLDSYLRLFEFPEEERGLASQNLGWLKSDAGFVGFLSSLRNVEIATSHHISYREFWTAIALAVLGGVESPFARTRLDQLSSRVNDDGVHAGDQGEVFDRESIAEVIDLANRRTHQSIYGVSSNPLGQKRDLVRLAPLLEMTTECDPVRDAHEASVGFFGAGIWVRSVVDALRGQDGEDGALSVVVESLREAQFELLPTQFDSDLDDVISRAVRESMTDRSPISAVDLERVMCWYAEYLLRLVASAFGITAFQEAISRWTDTWAAARRGDALASSRKLLRQLLLPPLASGRDARHLVSVFSSRTEPLTRYESEPRLAVEFGDDARIRFKVDGDELFAHFLLPDHEVDVQFAVDVSLLREADACSEGGGGFTENSPKVAPRLERYRSSLVSPSLSGSGLRLIRGWGVEEVNLR